jgi:Cdc25 family phosphatase
MSSISIATLPRMSRDILAALLLSGTTSDQLAIIDVRDSGMPSNR